MPSDRILVVLVNFHLTRDVRRLLSGSELLGCDKLVVDNGAEPEEVRLLCELYNATPVILPTNIGFAGAINHVACHFADYKHVLLLNPDVELEDGQVSALRERLVHEKLTGVSPLLIGTDGVSQVGTAGGRVTNAAFVAYFLFASHISSRLRGLFFTRRQLREHVSPDWLCMACLLLDGQATKDYGLLPEDEIVYGEDIVWGCRASELGATFAVATDISVVHRRGAAGSGSAWRGAAVRMLRREVGPLRSCPGVFAFHVGLGLRRALGRPV